MPYTPTQQPDPPMVTDPACKVQVRTEYNVYRCYTEAEYQTMTAERAAQAAARREEFKSGPWPLIIIVVCVAFFLIWIFTPSGPEIVRISRRD